MFSIDYLFNSRATEWNCSCDYRIKCYCSEQMRLTQTNKSEIGVEKTNSIHNHHTPTNFRTSTQTRSYRNNRIPINIQANTVSKRNNILYTTSHKPKTYKYVVYLQISTSMNCKYTRTHVQTLQMFRIIVNPNIDGIEAAASPTIHIECNFSCALCAAMRRTSNVMCVFDDTYQKHAYLF